MKRRDFLKLCGVFSSWLLARMGTREQQEGEISKSEISDEQTASGFVGAHIQAHQRAQEMPAGFVMPSRALLVKRDLASKISLPIVKRDS